MATIGSTEAVHRNAYSVRIDMDRGNRTVVLTAFGCTDEVLGNEDGTFEYMRGFCQGASGWHVTTSIWTFKKNMQSMME